MTLLKMIEEWRKGCSCTLHEPENCRECTSALIDAMEYKLKKEAAIRKLKVEFELEMLEIKNTYHGIGVGVAALYYACAAVFAGRLKSIIACSPMNKCKQNEVREVTVKLVGSAMSCSDVDKLVKSINDQIHAAGFNYPECLNRIVDVAVARAESEILKFAEADEIERRHEEMMSRLCKPPQILGLGGKGGRATGFPMSGIPIIKSEPGA